MVLTELNYQSTIEAPVPNGPQKLWKVKHEGSKIICNITRTRDEVLERRISSTDKLKQIQQSSQLFVELGREHDDHGRVRHDLINC